MSARPSNIAEDEGVVKVRKNEISYLRFINWIFFVNLCKIKNNGNYKNVMSHIIVLRICQKLHSNIRMQK